ncbi:hypothetical protein OROHE_003862 [Orobanche hederae]
MAEPPSSTDKTTTRSSADPSFSGSTHESRGKPRCENNNDNTENTRNKRAKDNSSGDKHPVYRGVRMRSWGKWVSEIRQPRKKSRIWLGTYPTAEMAARAHDVAEMSIKGGTAILNFPHLIESLPRPASLAPRDVQAAAAQAAAMEELGLLSASLPSSPATSNSLSSSRCEANSDELGEIIELPSLECSYTYELAERRVGLTMADSADGWLHPPWWASDKDFCEYFLDQVAAGGGSLISMQP